MPRRPTAGARCWSRTRATRSFSTTSPAARASQGGPPTRSSTSAGRSRCTTAAGTWRRATRTSTRSATSPVSASWSAEIRVATAVLVTGMSGTGKSSALGELGRRGYEVVDTDEPGWKVWRPGDSEWVWDEERVAELLDQPRGVTLFVSGCVPNQGRLYDRF